MSGTYQKASTSTAKAVLEVTKKKQHVIVMLLLKTPKFIGKRLNRPLKMFRVLEKHGFAGLRKYNNARSAKERRIYLESKIAVFEAQYKKECENNPEKAKATGELLQRYKNRIQQLLEDEKGLTELL